MVLSSHFCVIGKSENSSRELNREPRTSMEKVTQVKWTELQREIIALARLTSTTYGSSQDGSKK